VEFSKLMALLSAILTILALAAYIALQLAWALRQIDCNRECARPQTVVWSSPGPAADQIHCHVKQWRWLTRLATTLLPNCVATGLPAFVPCLRRCLTAAHPRLQTSP
jgi:hypothetical protein